MAARVNIHHVLRREKSAHTQDDIITGVYSLLRDDLQKEKDIEERLRKRISSGEVLVTPSLPFPAHDVFGLSEIRRTCIHYRLRFLDSGLFKGKIPMEAIFRVRELERKHGVAFTSFRIIAPMGMFALEDPHKDPLLFARLNDGQYLFIHKWGNDLSSLRKWLALPFRDFNTFLVFLASLSILVNLCLPSDIIAPSERWKAQEYSIRGFLLIHFFLLFAGISIFFFFSKGRGVSEIEWNSRYSA